MQQIGMKLIQEKKAEIAREGTEKNRQEKSSFEGLERGDLRGRDLLTLLIKANMAMDIPESQRLSDEDVLARAYRPSPWFGLIISLTIHELQRFLPSWLPGTRRRARRRPGVSLP